MRKIDEEIFSFFPCHIELPNEVLNSTEEIRIRLGQSILVRYADKEFLTKQIANERIILNLLENFTENSIYAMQSEINSGFVTIKGGHRVGISGTCIFENGKIKNIRYISSLNIRVAHEVKGCAVEIVNELYGGKNFENTLILSSPRMWKNNAFKGHDQRVKL